MEKIFNHPEIGPITLRKRVGNKSIRISVSSRRGILVSLPWFVSYSRAIKFVEEKSSWIEETLRRQKERFGQTKDNGKVISAPETPAQVEALRRQARKELVPLLTRLALENGFTDKAGAPMFRRVAIKNNISNWGSCSGKNNINLNMRLMLVPDELRRYVLLHELCHLRHHDHGKEFHLLLNKLCGGREKEFSRELKSYRLE